MNASASTERAAWRYGPNIFTDLDLRIPAQPIFVIMLVLGPMLYIIVAALSASSEVASRCITLSAIMQALSGIGLWLDHLNDLVGRWFTILVLIIILLLASVLFHAPEPLILAAVPAMLAIPLIGFPAAVVTTLGETLLLVLALAYAPASLDALSVGVALMSIWGSLGVMYVIYHPMRQLVEWV